MTTPKFSVRQITAIITDAAERCDYSKIGVDRNPHSISVRFSDNYIYGDDMKIGTHDFSFDRSLFYCEYDGNDLKQISEDDWFKEVDRYFWTVCGVHLDITAAERA